MFMLQRWTQCLQRIELGQRNSQSNEAQAGAGPGEKSPLVGKVVAGHTAGIRDRLWGEVFQDSRHVVGGAGGIWVPNDKARNSPE